ncbi:endonuclease domain-containing protein [Variibacter gotjawalensis]|uniref:endonuclease domain-containing protein n=2 Tax=Variibacter gotjawalensis TaxID=1333996 RepID=UPI000BBABCC0|nr:DUF559 domain-containing protein [Variibacter gotjawalensis]
MSRDLRVPRARRLRRDMTAAERKLWQHLRRRPDAHFRRQATLGSYFADFACHTHRLVIELDGGQHATQVARDGLRDAYMSAHGYRVLRFWNNEVSGNLDGVLAVIAAALSATAVKAPPTPNPSPPSAELRSASGGGERNCSAPLTERE